MSLRPGKSDYAGLQYRPVFYDFNGMESSNHFQLHFGAGVRFYVTDSIFVRPQFDLHWVNNFFQFGSNLVPAYGAVIGYSFGGH